MNSRSADKKSFWTLRYALLNIAYFVAFCTVHALAAVYLLAHGFSNTEVGILLAVANITSAIVQPVVAGLIDKPGYLTNRRFILISVLVIMAGALILRFFPCGKGVIFVIYALIYMIQFAYQPVMTALCFEYNKAGAGIFYGLARGLGSAGFAIASAFMGAAVEENGVDLLMIVTMITMAVSAVLIFTFTKPKDRETASLSSDETIPAGSKAVAHNSIFAFAATYPAFMLFLLGTVCFFFAHNMINDFMIQIIRSLGGGETELGYSNFLQAILELPVMALISFVLKKISSGKLMVFSAVAFFVKTLILVFATNMGWMYFSQSFQLFAYAVFIPATAYYVTETMEELDQVKGQAYVTSAITLGGVFSNFISGVILDNAGIKAMLITGTCVAAAGAVIAFAALKFLPGHRTPENAAK